jgi:hypothetical protein
MFKHGIKSDQQWVGQTRGARSVSDSIALPGEDD